MCRGLGSRIQGLGFRGVGFRVQKGSGFVCGTLARESNLKP